MSPLRVLCFVFLLTAFARSQSPTIQKADMLLTEGKFPDHAIRFTLASKPNNVQSIVVKTIQITKPDKSVLAIDPKLTKIAMHGSGTVGTISLNQALPDSSQVPSGSTFDLTLKIDDNDAKVLGQKIIGDDTIIKSTSDAIDAFNKAAEATKVGSDKDFLASMAVSIPSGNSGDAQGSADFSFFHEYGPYAVLTGKLIDQLTLGATLNKGSATLADPRHFQVGAALQKNLLLHDKDKIADLAKFINGETTSVPHCKDKNGKELPPGNCAESLRNHVFNVLFIDSGLSFEGDVKGTAIGNVSNFLFTADTKLVSPNYANGDGYAAIRFEPASLETGYNVQNSDAPSAANHGLARYKAGLEGTLAYDFHNIPIARVELTLNTVERYLFLDENGYDSTTKAVTRITKGSHYYGEGALKIFFANTIWGRTGFQASFRRGGLPPTYADTRAVTAGFVYETSDDYRNTK